MKLTKEIRERIVGMATGEYFTPKKKAIDAQEHDLGMELYHHVFNADELAKVSALPRFWLRHDGCLRFNCGGYDIRFTVKTAVPVPYSTHCASLGSVTGALSDKAQAFAQSKQDLGRDYDRAKIALMKMLESVSTVKRLKQIWPEGEKFYAQYLDTPERPGVPAIQVTEINKMLGLGAAA
jgi:hypothetical protein